MDLSNLKAGERYAFHIKPFEPPIGDVIPGAVKERRYVGARSIGAVGTPAEPFAEVERDDGTRHLIAVSTIDAIMVV